MAEMKDRENEPASQIRTLKVRYLASVFLDAASIQPKGKLISELIGKLEDDELSPADVGEWIGTGFQRRIGFVASDTAKGMESSLTLLSRRFDYTQSATSPLASGLADFGTFCGEAGFKLTALLDYFGRKASRIATVQYVYLPELSETRLQDVSMRLLRMPPTFQKTAPFEWDWRCASVIDREIGEAPEPTNTIMIAKRRSIGRQVKEIEDRQAKHDILEFNFDTNTSPENQLERFGGKEIGSFFEQAPSWHEGLENELMSFCLL